jgi:hypothetical protein
MLLSCATKTVFAVCSLLVLEAAASLLQNVSTNSFQVMVEEKKHRICSKGVFPTSAITCCLNQDTIPHFVMQNKTMHS